METGERTGDAGDRTHRRDAAARNRAFYDRLSGGQDDYWTLMAAPVFRVRRILELVRAARPSRLCDFGCGNGALLAEVARAMPAAQLFGLDLSAPLVADDAERMPSVAFAAADLSAPDFAFPWPRVDMAVSSEVIEHVDAPENYLANVAGALVPGGTLALSTQSGPVHATERHVGHVRHWRAAEMEALLRGAGFSEVRVWNEGFPFHDLSKRLANLNPQKALASFGQGRYTPAQRLVCAALRVLFLFNSRTSGAQLYALARR
ncbi:MAG: class I SAM-dependent methyltransferase [Desulfovibrionaceae bacterium]|nr:class I SAM-dependent methyltransferase [Desulfovibrionaceae bacterium]